MFLQRAGMLKTSPAIDLTCNHAMTVLREILARACNTNLSRVILCPRRSPGPGIVGGSGPGSKVEFGLCLGHVTLTSYLQGVFRRDTIHRIRMPADTS